jgi:Zn-dependent M28 family amino/carboxypeptidase
MKQIYLGLVLLFSSYTAWAQGLSSQELLNILQGNYNPSSYSSSQPIDASDQISCELINIISADTLHQNLETLSGFGTRHTWSDTLSNTRGIGAARRWIESRFQSYSARNENRLRSGFFSFDITNNSCGDLFATKNVIGVLPGRDTSDKSVILMMAHMDSRCEGRCDTACYAPGADDNGSGTVLVMELARVLSQYTFNHTLVFMLTNGEEQGLLGARAFSDYCSNNGISIKAVLNNDIVGGTICGQTASPPGCSPAGDIDSIRVRMYGNPLSDRNPYQGYARSVKMNFDEKLRPNLFVKPVIELVNQEDRSGRGGDHIAFRENGFLNVRFTSAHEHGNGNPLGTPNYQDHQHTSLDEIGIDLDSNGTIDSFYVDFNYLRRNALINGTSAVIIDAAPEVPSFTLHDEAGGLRLEVMDSDLAFEYRVGVKGPVGGEYDSLYRFQGRNFVIPGLQANQLYLIGLAALDSNGLMSPFTQDDRETPQVSTPPGTTDNLPYSFNCMQVTLQELPEFRQSGLEVMPPRPNPNHGQSELVFWVRDQIWEGPAVLRVLDYQGREVYRQDLNLKYGASSVNYNHQGRGGVFFYYIEQAGKRSVVQRMLVK